ncbi:NAD-dependent epimerase/dehydratase family protein [Marinobacter sp. M216]|uniref:NAD-dependent epimerase/dehydratase family protein n=1 Tax=Marinobacter albus TaxID=3030833 RepID=A0ABT7HC41_9GAMM|nr:MULTISPECIES: NAD-dependent epimerase/dehydratase family protein [unclassified Marinobacter]MBW7469822.1 NAD-dependent epimerase/dehydratase family protein [Marinobacter sp. F4218]MDK9557919.1 NAD-dependent epimerase/dehydratase family protein [Marinobacter sp. M216]
MKTIDKTAPVLVTGATGYVAGWLVKRLLDEGLTVHAAVRDPDDPEKLKYLNSIAEGAPGTIRYFKADLLEDGSYADAMAGCELVFHTASPFTRAVSDPLKELVEPAKLGTRNVLSQATKTPGVKRVVVTSSCAAIYGDNADLKNAPNGVIDESIWNTSSSLDNQPYSYSKTVAEQEAWKIAEQQDQWDLVTINPSLVIGPGINPHATSESFNLIKQMGDGRMKPGVPRVGIGVVDVRDVAEAHFQAGFTPEAAGRYIVSGHNTDFFELAQTLREKYGDRYPVPRRALPKWLVWLVGPLADKTINRTFIARNVDWPWRADNSKGKRELGLSYRPVKESMEGFFQQMIDSGLLPRR